MNRDIARYKYNFLTFVLVIAYALMHIRLTGSYVDATLEQLFSFSVRMPFAQRVLTPLVLQILSDFFNVNLYCLTFLLECIFSGLTYWALFSLLKYELDKKQAQLLSLLFFLILPVITVVNYRLAAPITDTFAAFYYPYDTATLFFMFAGLLFCLREQWIHFIILLIFATLNRESSFLLVLSALALYWRGPKRNYMYIISAALVYWITHLSILYFIDYRGGGHFDYIIPNTDIPRFTDNLFWLFAKENLLLFMYCFAFLPLFWFAFSEYIPRKFIPIKYVALFSFSILLYVGSFKEARIFSEIVALLYLPVCIGIRNWLQGEEPILVSGFQRYDVLIFIGGLLLFSSLLTIYITH
jgi:hypothetical protein